VKGKSVRFTVLMPVYNERAIIRTTIAETCRALSSRGGRYEIIAVDDGSTDGTWEELRRAARQFRSLRIKRHRANRGKGRALKFAWRFARGEVVAMLDADMEIHPRQLLSLADVMKTSGADAVIGSKRHPASKLKYPILRGALSRLFSVGVRVLFGLPLRDTQTGIKLFKAGLLREVFPKVSVRRYVHDVEILVYAHRAGYRIVEAPVKVRFRRRNLGRIGWVDFLLSGLDTLGVFLRLNFPRLFR
jgi:dolichol-phosphate mannosyltransferase